MKTKSVTNALNKILSGKTDGSKTVYTNGNKTLEVIDQNGNAICLPILNGEVVHNGNYTIKNLVSFITDGLNEDQISYLKTLRSLYSTTPNEKRIENAKQYISIF